jgi:uncharacterized protein
MTQTNTLLGTEEQPLVTPTSDERTMAILTHILALPTGFIAPLVIYLLKKDSAYVTAHSKEALNFQITVAIAVIICRLMMFILIGFVLLSLVFLADLILVIIATIRASENKLYKYPFSIRFIK